MDAPTFFQEESFTMESFCSLPAPAPETSKTTEPTPVLAPLDELLDFFNRYHAFIAASFSPDFSEWVQRQDNAEAQIIALANFSSGLIAFLMENSPETLC